MPPSVKMYWKLYGGFRALVVSSYWCAAIIFTLIINLFATNSDLSNFRSLQISLLPTLLAFSLGGFTVFLTMPINKKMRAVLEIGEIDSLYLKIISAIFHFILVQVIAIILSIISFFVGNPAVDLLVIFATIYAIMCGLATAVLLLGLARFRNLVLDGRD